MVDYLHRFNDVVGPQRLIQSPTVGNKLVKSHGMGHMTEQIKELGAAPNCYGGFLESALKTFIKGPGKRTRKTHQDFDLDLVKRWSEYQTIISLVDSLDINVDGPVKSSEDGQSVQTNASSLPSNHDYATFRSVSQPVFYFFREVGSGQRRNWHTRTSNRKEEFAYVTHPFAGDS